MKYEKNVVLLDEFLKFIGSRDEFINILSNFLDMQLQAEFEAGVEKGEISAENNNVYFSYNFCVACLCKLTGGLLGCCTNLYPGEEVKFIDDALGCLRDAIKEKVISIRGKSGDSDSKTYH